MRQLFLVLLLFILSLLGLVALFNTCTNYSKQSNIVLATNWPNYPNAEQHLVEALQLPSRKDSISSLSMHRFYGWVQDTYPLLFDNPNLEWKEFGRDNWVVKWVGRNADLAPIVWVASPQTSASSSTATASNSATAIYGQGSRGSKGAMIAMLEVLHQLVKQERLPDRTIYFAFPFPAQEGTERVLQALAQAGTPAEYILQTGGGIADYLLWDLSEPVALLGVGQLAKAQLTLVRNSPKTTWRTIKERLEAELPAANLDHEVAKNLLYHLSPELPFGQRFVFSNSWLLDWSQNAYFAPASLAKQLVGMSARLIPTKPYSDTAQLLLAAPELTASTLQTIQEAIKLDSVNVISNWQWQQGFATASMESRSYRLLGNTCKEVFPDVVTAPIWVPATISSKALNTPVFYFHPIRQGSSQSNPALMSEQEGISRQNYQRLLYFYHQLLSNSI